MVMSIYGCGGCGINIAKQFINVPEQKGSCKVVTYLTDTSESNLKGLSHNNKFVFEGLDGSGKKRDENYAAIKERTKKLLYDFKPSKFNLVIHSASGGTGSVIGPLLASELNKQEDKIVVPVIVGNSNNLIEAENTLKTLKTYENIASRSDKPIVMIYDHNRENRNHTDKRLTMMITLMIVLFSKDNIEIDSEDIRNFFHFSRVTSHPSNTIGILNAYTADNISPNDLIASAVRLKEESDAKVYDDMMVEYLTEGFIPADVVRELQIKLPITFTVSINSLNKTVDEILTTINKFKELRETQSYSKIKINTGHEDDNGIVL